MEKQEDSSEAEYLRQAAEDAAAQLTSSSAPPSTANTNGHASPQAATKSSLRGHANVNGGGGGSLTSSHASVADAETHVYVAYPRPLTTSIAASAASPHAMYGAPLLPASVGRHNGFLRTHKVLIVGEAGVGKSNLMHRYCHNAYDPALPSTLGAEFCARDVDIPCGAVGMTETVVLQLWDTAGQERNAGVISNAFYRNAVGAILVYDVTRRETLVNLPRWAARVMELACGDCVCVVVGAKLDLLTGEARHAGALDALQQEADRISHAMGMRNFMTSALSGTGVLEAFTHLVLAVDAVQAAAALEPASTLPSSTPTVTHPQPYRQRSAYASPTPPRGGPASRGTQMWTAACSVPVSPMRLMGGVEVEGHPSRWPSAGLAPSSSTTTTLAAASQQQQLARAASAPAMHESGAYSGPASSLEHMALRQASRASAAAPSAKKKPLDLRGFGSAEGARAGGGAVQANSNGPWGC